MQPKTPFTFVFASAKFFIPQFYFYDRIKKRRFIGGA